MKLFLKQGIAAQMGVVFLLQVRESLFSAIHHLSISFKVSVQLTFKQFKCVKSLAEGENQVLPY